MPDFEINNEILQGLEGITEKDKDDKPKSKADNATDKKHVIISLFTGLDKLVKGGAEIKSVPNPTVYEMDGLVTNWLSDEDVLKVLKEHVSKYGTIDEVIIIGHGKKNRMGSDGLFSSSENSITIGIPYIIHKMAEIKDEVGNKVTNRIVFAGCGTFSDEGPKGAAYFRGLAKMYELEIVGTTSTLCMGPLMMAGRFVQFTPKGEIIRDKLDTKYNPLALIGNEADWANCFIGTTQEEGERRWKQVELEQKAALKWQERMNRCSDFGPKY